MSNEDTLVTQEISGIRSSVPGTRDKDRCIHFLKIIL